MRKIFISFLLVLCHYGYCQKRNLHSSDLNKWPLISKPAVSVSGNFLYYYINHPDNYTNGLIVQNLKTGSKLEIPPDVDIYSVGFTPDENQLYFRKKDSIGIVNTHSLQVEYISGISSFKVSAGKPTFLAYYSASTLTVRNLGNSVNKIFTGVKEYEFDPTGTPAILISTNDLDSTQQVTLSWQSVLTDEIETIYRGEQASNLIIDATGKRIAFSTIKNINGTTEKSFWIYNVDTKKTSLLVDNHSPGVEDNYFVEQMIGFSSSGRQVFLYLKKKQSTPVKNGEVNLDVWNYKDSKLQSQQLKAYPKSVFRAIVNLDNSIVTQIESDFDVPSRNLSYLESKDMGFVYHRASDVDPLEYHWREPNQSIILLNYKDGSRKTVLKLTSNQRWTSESREGKYLIYYDGIEKNFYSYSFIDGLIRNITRGILTDWSTPYRNDKPDGKFYPRNLPVWLKGDSAVFLHDQYDIWQIDPSGSKAPINITGGYGRKHNILFNVALSEYSTEGIREGELIYLNAFNVSNKENGYYNARVGKSSVPKLLSMGPYFYELSNNPYVLVGTTFPALTAKSPGLYIVRRMSEKEHSNLFSTSDFKTFIALSDIHPERSFNWMTTELVTWKSPHGSLVQGILYKPEDFNPHKKYPVIFNYYERKSQNLHYFFQPEFSGDLCIPLFVSNGYLVFTPDFHYTIGHPLQSALEAVSSAAEVIAKYPFVDSKKMGIQGFSFGGIETNFIVTHSTRFAAACSASGIADFISGYGSLMSTGNSLQFMYEEHQMRIGATLWERPDLYIDNSAVFHANKVATPLLMLNNKNDGVCPFSNAVEFFTALRRLNKKAWMLQYDDGKHSMDGKSAIDFSIRMKQFFDHYLKAAPAPIWITKGIPATLKGIEMGYQLDPAGNCGKDCKVCTIWNEKMKKDCAGTMKEIEQKTKTEHWVSSGHK